DAGGAEVDEVDGFGRSGGFLDEREEGGGGGDGDVDAPAFVEEPAVLGVVDARDDAGNVELAFGEQRDDEGVFVVSGGGDKHVALGGARLFEDVGVAGVAVEYLCFEVAFEPVNEFVVDFDEGDFVAADTEGAGHFLAEDTGAGDDGSHWPRSLLRKL